MPIYEFYCKRCNTIYNFFSRAVNTTKIPCCPNCKKVKLTRMISSFATISRRTRDMSTDEDTPRIDEAKMAKAMEMLASEAEKINENDPRQAARLMRKISDAAGVTMGPGMEEALSRLERGEDPDEIEEEMGDLLQGEDIFSPAAKGKRRRRKPAPQRDENLYEL